MEPLGKKLAFHPAKTAAAAEPTDGPAARSGAANLARLYQEHSDYLRVTIARLGGPGIDEDDILQQIFAVTLSRRGGSPFGGEIRSERNYLTSIAVRAVAQARRKAKVRAHYESWTFDAELADSPAEQFDFKETLTLVYRALDGMPEPKRTAWILTEIEGLNNEELAQITGTNVANARRRLADARKMFAAIFERLDPDNRSTTKAGEQTQRGGR